MPSGSRVRNFRDAGDYAAAIRAKTAEVTVMSCGQFEAELIGVDLHDIAMHRFSENLARVAHFEFTDERDTILFQTKPGASLRWNGIEMRCSAVIRRSYEHGFFQRSSGAVEFGAMSLPRTRIAPVVAAISGFDLAPPDRDLVMTPRPEAMATLLRLHAEAGELAKHAPETIAHPKASRGLEHALTTSFAACLSTTEIAEDVSAKRRHEKIMRRFHAAIAERGDEAVYIPELCIAVGVPHRTLHLCCHEALGMGPKRYLVLRRMHLARNAIRKSNPAKVQITDIAATYGFWNFGRFSVEYRAMFNESPSQTLQKMKHSPRDFLEVDLPLAGSGPTGSAGL